jgi:hypothetical protein
MADRLSPSDLTARRVYWLVDLVFAGMTIRIADDDLDVETEDGDVLRYAGVLNVLDVTEGLDFLSDASASPTSISLSAVLPGVDVPALVAAGHDLSSMTGSVARWVEGTTYEKRRVVLADAIAKDPEHGSSLEPVALTFDQNPWDDPTTLPGPGLAVEGANWEDDQILSLAEGDLGLVYPLVFGKPGAVSTHVNVNGMVTGSQPICVWADATDDAGAGSYNVLWLVAGHHVEAKRAYVVSNEWTTPARVRIVNGYDKQGHPVALIPWWGLDEDDPDAPKYPYAHDPTVVSYAYNTTDTDGNPTYTAGSPVGPSAGADPDVIDQLRRTSAEAPASVFMCWVDDIDHKGGLRSSTGGTMRNPAEIIQWMLERNGAPVDRGRFTAAAGLLSPFNLDFTIDATCKPWEYITSSILPVLPISIVTGPSGFYPVVWRYDAKAGDAVCHLDADVDPYILRETAVGYDRTVIANDITLQYALSIRKSTYVATLRYAADSADGAVPSWYCDLSQRRYARRDGSRLIVPKKIQSPVIYEDATAHAVLSWITRARAFAHRRVEFLIPEAVYGWLERGQVVTVTDSTIGWSEAICIIEAIGTRGGPMLTVKLLRIEDPARD